jgi:hypothetical protein
MKRIGRTISRAVSPCNTWSKERESERERYRNKKDKRIIIIHERKTKSAITKAMLQCRGDGIAEKEKEMACTLGGGKSANLTETPFIK